MRVAQDAVLHELETVGVVGSKCASWGETSGVSLAV